MGRMQRTKGATFERLVTGLFRQVYPGAKRGIGQARAASEVPDVDVPGWWPELKHGIAPSWRAALKQAQKASKGTTRTPLVITRDNGGPIMVHVQLETFLELLKFAKERADELGVPLVDRLASAKPAA